MLLRQSNAHATPAEKAPASAVHPHPCSLAGEARPTGETKSTRGRRQISSAGKISYQFLSCGIRKTSARVLLRAMERCGVTIGNSIVIRPRARGAILAHKKSDRHETTGSFIAIDSFVSSLFLRRHTLVLLRPTVWFISRLMLDKRLTGCLNQRPFLLRRRSSVRAQTQKSQACVAALRGVHGAIR